MMLRASVELEGGKVDMNVVSGDTGTVKNSIPFGDILVEFAEAAVRLDADAIDNARGKVVENMGTDALVDAAAVVGNFQRMVRIANATGISLDTPMDILSRDLQKKLGFNKFGSAANTPDESLLHRAAGKVMGPLTRGVMKGYGAMRNSLK